MKSRGTLAVKPLEKYLQNHFQLYMDGRKWENGKMGNALVWSSVHDLIFYSLSSYHHDHCLHNKHHHPHHHCYNCYDVDLVLDQQCTL